MFFIPANIDSQASTAYHDCKPSGPCRDPTELRCRLASLWRSKCYALISRLNFMTNSWGESRLTLAMSPLLIPVS